MPRPFIPLMGIEQSMKKGEGKMEKRRKKSAGAAAVAAGVLTAILCTGCGAFRTDYAGLNTDGANSYVTENAAPSAGGSFYDSESMEVTEGNGQVTDNRKLITTVQIDLETKEFEQTMSVLEAQIGEMGGYVESMETYNGSSYSGSRSSRYSNMDIRIPADKLNGFLRTVSDVGNITRRNDSVNDVTLSYVDMESRRDTLRTEQGRLLEFLERADSVETVIALEERLSEVRYQLESMESQLRTMDNLVEYSTVHLNITEVKELTPVIERTAWERISEGFAESLQDIGNGFMEACIWFVVNIPYFIIWLAVIFVIIAVARRFGRKRRLAKEKKLENLQKKETGQN